MKAVKDFELIVWIIDDDLVSLFSTRYGIEQWNKSCKVVDFSNGETALKTLSEAQDTDSEIPDIILLDIVMPSMDGWEFLAEFEALTKPSGTTDVYLLSAFRNSKDRKRADEHSSIKGYFEKPISKDTFEGVSISTLMASKTI